MPPALVTAASGTAVTERVTSGTTTPASRAAPTTTTAARRQRSATSGSTAAPSLVQRPSEARRASRDSASRAVTTYSTPATGTRDDAPRSRSRSPATPIVPKAAAPITITDVPVTRSRIRATEPRPSSTPCSIASRSSIVPLTSVQTARPTSQPVTVSGSAKPRGNPPSSSSASGSAVTTWRAFTPRTSATSSVRRQNRVAARLIPRSETDSMAGRTVDTSSATSPATSATNHGRTDVPAAVPATHPASPARRVMIRTAGLTDPPPRRCRGPGGWSHPGRRAGARARRPPEACR